ncbi:hypothetical protein [Goodfellowiella coeruleoviolacea]|uniref:Guanylate cyclase domain-containing protein n=1 Tax=Goodfellowiella coeruleoviolacea TaxID=334858 RepID=A0AAE3GLW3_9PSEU|nr:hypothetical protein [Goodfellowiella coeruleoviolacea]MCP2169814.1 hypothetical protein [Goodfellowiella coeruleoviolacea]
MTPEKCAHRRSGFLAVDVQGYGRVDDQRQVEFQRTLVNALDQAGAAAGLDRAVWTRTGRGDEEFALLADPECEPRVLDDFVRELDALLRCYNRDRLPEARLRLRVAIHHGVTSPGPNGLAGRGVVVVHRLLNAEPLRAALAAAEHANLAVLVSRPVFEDTVAQGYTSLDPRDFRRIAVRVKEFHDDAWLRVPGTDVHALNLDPVATTRAGSVNQGTRAEGHSSVTQAGRDVVINPGQDRRPAPTHQVNNHLTARTINARGANFGLLLQPGENRDGQAQ